MEKLILSNFQAPGDAVMLTAAVRDLHRSYPGRFLTDVRTPYPELWDNNPYLNEIDDDARTTLLTKLVEAHEQGAHVLVIEPIAKRALPWWPEWEGQFTNAGGRSACKRRHGGHRSLTI